MKRFNEIGISPIKCENKEGNDCLKDYLYSINGLLFHRSKRYASEGAVNRLKMALADICKNLKEQEFPDKCLKKQQEILSRCRDMYKSLNEYKSDDDIDQCKSVLKYQVSQYIKDKESIKNDDSKIIEFITTNKELYDDYLGESSGITSFKKMQDELFELLKDKYHI